MRTAAAVLVALLALVGEVSLLMQDGTQLWQLVAVGAIGGGLVGAVQWGGRGALFGVVVGSVLGLLAPILYAPFWLVFTLPPHPEYDL